MLTLLAFVLNAITNAFINKLVEFSSDEVIKKLRKDPTKVAFRKALGAAIQDYANEKNMRRMYLAPSLLEENGFLTFPTVIEELTHLVRFDREPDTKLIGQKWKGTFEEPPTWCDFTAEAQDFILLLGRELRTTDVFRPVFDAQSLAVVATNTTISAQSLLHIETQLAQLQALLESHFVDLVRAFSGASLDIRDHILDYTSFIKERAGDFVGRQFVVDAFTRFTEQYPSGYIFLRGDPGIGKSAFAARMVQLGGYAHHFNIRSEGISTTDKFLKNICSQLIARYTLDYPFLPAEATQDAVFLHTLLEKVSTQLGKHEKAVIIVDALDEVDRTALPAGANILYLPTNLPPQIYFLVTMRRVELNVRIECAHRIIDIVYDSPENIADIREYLTRATGRPGIQRYITAQGIDDEQFISNLADKSEGNFMYLRYVLSEIERGVYKDRDLKGLPSGLQNYYKDHWQRMSSKDQESWFQYELPVIATLTAVYKPVSVQFIEYVTKIPPPRITAILAEWDQFLHSEPVSEGDTVQERYWVYHMSFRDFLAEQKVVKSELTVLQQAHRNIARSLLQKGP